MEQSSNGVSVSSTCTDYGSTTLKTRGATNNPNPQNNQTQNTSSSNNRDSRDNRENRENRDNNSCFESSTDTGADTNVNADTDYAAARIRGEYFNTRFCSRVSTNVSVGYQSLPAYERDQDDNDDQDDEDDEDDDDANVTTHLFAQRATKTAQQRFTQHHYSRRLGRYTKMSTTNTSFGKMSIDSKGISKNNQLSALDGARIFKLQHLEIFLGVLNQVCIGFVTIYMSWLCLRAGLAGTALHAWLVTIGFSLLMAEAVMCHYSANMLTFNYKRTTKTTIHWILQVLGGGCGVAGVLIKCIQKGFLLQSVHGKLGFAAFILCLVSMLSGLAALFPLRLKHVIQPLLNKTLHNFLGIATFVIALTAQFYGYKTGFFSRRVEKDFQTLMECLTLISLVLTCIGPLKAFWLKLRNIKKLYF